MSAHSLPVTPPRTLSTADARREELLSAAMRVFGERGLQAPTSAVAKEAGISHAYLFRLYPTKSGLAVALMRRVHERIHAAFADAAAAARAAGDEPLEHMGRAYLDLIQTDTDLLRVQLQGHAAAASDPVLQEEMRRGFGVLVESVRTEARATDEQLDSFFATGMLLNVLVAMEAFDLDTPWARTLCRVSETPDS